jgi:autotransporter strand-loop-strand O-heptosyltransferase
VPFETTKDKFITIATNSTTGCKFWTKEGWQEVINYLVSQGYKVYNVSKEKNPFDNCIQIEDTSMDNTINMIWNSKFFIGLSSGLSWLAWALGKQVVMISNFTKADHEFQSNCIRITDESVCHGCWNNKNFKFDRGDWNWCPIWKGYDKQFECHNTITADKVIASLQPLIVL